MTCPDCPHNLLQHGPGGCEVALCGCAIVPHSIEIVQGPVFSLGQTKRIVEIVAEAAQDFPSFRRLFQ